MNESYPWYGLAEGDELQQGDVLMDCPTFRPTAANEFEEISTDVVILSQSCDLANDKLEIVQVCPIFRLDELGTKVRILPPYREHLAQAFARFFMRVGLPVDVPPFA